MEENYHALYDDFRKWRAPETPFHGNGLGFGKESQVFSLGLIYLNILTLLHGAEQSAFDKAIGSSAQASQQDTRLKALQARLAARRLRQTPVWATVGAEVSLSLLDDLISRMLSTDPGKRPSAEEVDMELLVLGGNTQQYHASCWENSGDQISDVSDVTTLYTRLAAATKHAESVEAERDLLAERLKALERADRELDLRIATWQEQKLDVVSDSGIGSLIDDSDTRSVAIQTPSQLGDAHLEEAEDFTPMQATMDHLAIELANTPMQATMDHLAIALASVSDSREKYRIKAMEMERLLSQIRKDFKEVEAQVRAFKDRSEILESEKAAIAHENEKLKESIKGLKNDLKDWRSSRRKDRVSSELDWELQVEQERERLRRRFDSIHSVNENAMSKPSRRTSYVEPLGFSAPRPTPTNDPGRGPSASLRPNSIQTYLTQQRAPVAPAVHVKGKEVLFSVDDGDGSYLSYPLPEPRSRRSRVHVSNTGSLGSSTTKDATATASPLPRVVILEQPSGDVSTPERAPARQYE
ncbi:hypothetical protein B0H63DRAFT_477472 [Podospora didyma]|uniref:Protein kinase domain-containing protein n=1 Tax=Podospora didyma TaxID=330526 RepID=A0AAE0KKA2_9PEZI|nr:hypothetical protein B0H63DRAFT_477472 [Podospora didyma]